MKTKLVAVVAMSMMMFGCSSSPETSQTEEKYMGEGNAEYDSLYHFGYNTGCRSASLVKNDPSIDDVNSLKDEVLDGIADFDDGWSAGTEACEDGISRSMYMVQKEK